MLVHFLDAVAHGLDVGASHHFVTECILLHEVLQGILRSIISVQGIHHDNAVLVDPLCQYQTVFGHVLVHFLDTVTHRHDDCTVAGQVTILSD